VGDVELAASNMARIWCAIALASSKPGVRTVLVSKFSAIALG
jgi:hypothetical protein